MIGGAKTMLIGNLITDQFLKVRDWPFGAALSMWLLLTVGIGFWIQSLVCNGSELFTFYGFASLCES